MANDIEGLKNIGKLAAKSEPRTRPAAAPDKLKTQAGPESGVKRAAKKRKKPQPSAPSRDTERLWAELEEQKKATDSLRKEKDQMESKSRNLALIIEKISSKASSQPAQQAQQYQAQDMTPRFREMEDKMAAQMKELAESFSKKEKEEGEAGEDKKKKNREDLTESINRTLERRLREMEEKMSAQLAPRVSAPTTAPAAELSKGLASFEGGVSMRKDTEEVKEHLSGLTKRFDEKLDDINSRFLNIERQFKRIEKIPDIEERVENLFNKLGPENVEKMRKLVYDASEISEEVIPHEIKKELISRFGPIFNDMRELKKNTAFLNTKNRDMAEELSSMRKDMKAFEKLKADLTDIEAGKEKFLTQLREEDNKSVDRVEEIREKFRVVISQLYKQIDDNQKLTEKLVEETIEKKLTKAVRSETDSMEHRLTLIITTIKERMEYLKSEIGEIHKKMEAIPEMKLDIRGMEKSIDKLYAGQSEMEAVAKELRLQDKKLRDLIEKLDTPSEIMDQLNKKTADAEDIKDFIIKRTNAIDNRINDLAEKSAPDRALFTTVDKLSGKVENLEKFAGTLEAQNEKLSEKLAQLLAQSAEERKNFEEKLSTQKKKFSSLLKEVRD